MLSDSASTKEFLLNAPKYSIIHLATHACIDESSSDLNKIFFDDGNLSQIDLDQLRIHAALTVLSACNTGTGKLQKGEGVLSMARSFLLAGSASVLTSLWAVDDCTTADLMLHYYSFLGKGQQKDNSLKLAKLAFLERADLEHSHPYYWSAFVQVGDTSGFGLEDAPMDIPTPMLLMGAVLLVGVLGLFKYGSLQKTDLRKNNK